MSTGCLYSQSHYEDEILNRSIVFPDNSIQQVDTNQWSELPRTVMASLVYTACCILPLSSRNTLCN